MSKLRRIWRDIKKRCLNPSSADYKYYGGRGITICDEWLDYPTFCDCVTKLKHFDEEGYSLDRIDNDGDYKPGNVRWIKKSLQCRNTRRNIFVDYFGVEMLLVDAAKITGINYSTLKDRYHKGDRDDRLFRPVKKVLPKSDLVFIQDNQVLTTSLIIAKTFGKRHDNIIRDIENAIATLEDVIHTKYNEELGEIFSHLKIEDVELSRRVCRSHKNRTKELKALESSFIKSEYVDAKGEKRPMYLLNRDAASFLIMGFTGIRAAKFKWSYIQAFNAMEQALKVKKSELSMF